MNTLHGTNAAYVAGCRCDDCRAAARDYHKRLIWDHHRGIRRRVDATGTRRRIEALGALGWTGAQIGAQVGISGEGIRQIRAGRMVNLTTASRIAVVYLAMAETTPPETTRTERHNASRQRNKAAREGWVAPTVWIDIDDPDEVADPGYTTQRPADIVDEVVVERVLAGHRQEHVSKAERFEVVRRWQELDRSMAELARITGWQVYRYTTDDTTGAVA